MPADDEVPGFVSECFESDGESGSSFPWTEESSDEGLDYFVALDVATAQTSPCVEGAGDLPSASTGYRRHPPHTAKSPPQPHRMQQNNLSLHPRTPPSKEMNSQIHH